MSNHMINGEPLEIEAGSVREIVCCDCSLAHTYLFYRDKGKLMMEVFRNDWLTKKERRRRRKK